MIPVEISAALTPLVNFVSKKARIVQGNLRPKENKGLVVAYVGVGADSQAGNQANGAKNRCT